MTTKETKEIPSETAQADSQEDVISSNSEDLPLHHEIKPLPSFVLDAHYLSKINELSVDEVGDYCFFLNGGKVLFGIALDESEDSFLVALATSLSSNNGEITVKLLTNKPMIRLFKSNVVFTCVPELEHRSYYYKFLLTIKDKLPGFFTDERLLTMETTLAVASIAKKTHDSGRKSNREHSGDSLSDFPFTSYDKLTRH